MQIDTITKNVFILIQCHPRSHSAPDELDHTVRSKRCSNHEPARRIFGILLSLSGTDDTVLDWPPAALTQSDGQHIEEILRRVLRLLANPLCSRTLAALERVQEKVGLFVREGCLKTDPLTAIVSDVHPPKPRRCQSSTASQTQPRNFSSSRTDPPSLLCGGQENMRRFETRPRFQCIVQRPHRTGRYRDRRVSKQYPRARIICAGN